MSQSLLEAKFRDVNRARFDSASPDKDCCGICSDPIVSDDRYRSMAKLQCRDEFHLKCVSLAFSAKKRMECPICGNVESEEWKLVDATQTRPVSYDRRRFVRVNRRPNRNSGPIPAHNTENNSSSPFPGLHGTRDRVIQRIRIVRNITGSEYRSLYSGITLGSEVDPDQNEE